MPVGLLVEKAYNLSASSSCGDALARLALLVAIAVLFLALFGCASMQQAGGNQGANAGDGSQGAGSTDDKIVLTGPGEIPGGKVGKPYEYSYCIPRPSGKSGQCGGFAQTSNPRGGKGPYSFYLGSGTGFPPVGLSLNLNGILSGVPTAAGYREFEVCAKDIGGDYACENYSLTVI